MTDMAAKLVQVESMERDADLQTQILKLQEIVKNLTDVVDQLMLATDERLVRLESRQ